MENITYMCSKVNIVDEGAAPAACYTELRNGREIEVCVCASRAGQQPCNGAAGDSLRRHIGLVVAAVLLLLLVSRTAIAGGGSSGSVE